MDRCTIGEAAQQAHICFETLRYTAREGCVTSPLRGVSHYRWSEGSSPICAYLRPFPPTSPSRHVLLTPEAWALSLC